MLVIYFLSFLLILAFVRASLQESRGAEPEIAPTIFVFDQEQVELFEFITLKERKMENPRQMIEKFAKYLGDREKVESVEHVFQHPASTSSTDLFETFVTESLNSMTFFDKGTPDLLGTAMIRHRRRILPRKTFKFTEADRFSFSGFSYFLRASKKFDLISSVLKNSDWALCDAAYFYRLITVEDAIECYSSGVVKYNPRVFGAFVGDMYFGELRHLHDKVIQGEKDAMLRAWVDQVRKDDVSGFQGEAAGYMIAACIQILRSRERLVDHQLLFRFLNAMITIRLSDLLTGSRSTPSPIKQELGSACDLYNFIVDNRIREEFIFSGSIPNHAVAIGFRLNEDFSTARVAIINSGEGIDHHKSFFKFKQNSREPEVDLHGIVNIYAPFATFESVPLSALKCGSFGDENDLYFKQLGLTRKSESHHGWQYTRGQFARTCYATSLWYSLYWLEQDSYQNLESLRHALVLEILKSAIKEYRIQVKREVRALVASQEKDDHQLHPALSSPLFLPYRLSTDGLKMSGKGYVRGIVHAPLSISDRLALYISVAMNFTIASLLSLEIRGLDMTPIMREYKALWEEMKDKRYWQPIKENVKDTYTTVHNQLLPSEPPIIPEKVAPKIPFDVQVVCTELDHAIDAKSAFDFTDAIRVALKEGHTHPKILEKVVEGAGKLSLQKHHMNILADSLTMMATKLAVKSPHLIPFDLLHKIFLELNFPAIYVYDQAIDLETVPLDPTYIADDAELLQHAVNRQAHIFRSQYVASYLLRLLRLAPDKRPLYVQKVMNELLKLPQHLFAFHLGHLIAKDAIRWQDLLPYKEHFEKLEDFEIVLLDFAIMEKDKYAKFASIIGFKDSYPSVSAIWGIKPTLAFRMSGWSNPPRLRLQMYAAYLLKNGRGAYIK